MGSISRSFISAHFTAPTLARLLAIEPAVDVSIRPLPDRRRWIADHCCSTAYVDAALSGHDLDRAVDEALDAIEARRIMRDVSTPPAGFASVGGAA